MTAEKAAGALPTREESDSGKKQSSIAYRELSAIAGRQIEAARAIQEVASRMTQAASDLTERQAAYFTANLELLFSAFSLDRDSGVAERIARQSECFRELTQISAKHLADVSTITATSCCDSMDHLLKGGGGGVSEAAIQRKRQLA